LDTTISSVRYQSLPTTLPPLPLIIAPKPKYL
jgi:hypothetical protein